MADQMIMATFHPQAWINGYAVETDPEGEVTFDVTDLVLESTGGIKRKALLKLRDDSFETDGLRYSTTAPEWIFGWSGPFYIEVADSIREYLEAEIEEEESRKGSFSHRGRSASEFCAKCGGTCQYDSTGKLLEAGTYHGDRCPDCEWGIPERTLENTECPGCGHVFVNVRADDDEETS